MGVPALLVSVRNADEAKAAVAGGADIIDIKEPLQGPLGMAEPAVIDDVIAAVSGRAPVSAALGETCDWLRDAGATDSASVVPRLPTGLTFAKLGLAGLSRSSDWFTDWHRVRSVFETAAGRPLPWVAVAYADADVAQAPPVGEIIAAAARTGCCGVLIDTWDKSGHGVLELIPTDELRSWRRLARERGLFFALAGRLRSDDLRRRSIRACNVVGIRSAACADGDRTQMIAASRVAELRRRLHRRGARTDRQARDAARGIRAVWGARPAVGLILGTGMGGLAEAIDVERTIAVRDVPHFRPPTAPGHRGRIVCGRLAGVPVIAFDGRCHLYEGYSPARIAFPVRVLRRLGARVLIATNAAGGLNAEYRVGDVMVVERHVDLMAGRGLSSIVDRLSTALFSRDAQGSAIPDSRLPASPYDPGLADAAVAAAAQAGFVARRGTYVGVIGPNYETRAEYRLFRAIGGDAVGMSTIPEVCMAARLGMRTLALSVITNVANPDALEPADAESVIHAAELTQASVRSIIERLAAQLLEERAPSPSCAANDGNACGLLR